MYEIFTSNPKSKKWVSYIFNTEIEAIKYMKKLKHKEQYSIEKKITLNLEDYFNTITIGGNPWQEDQEDQENVLTLKNFTTCTTTKANQSKNCLPFGE